MEERVDELLRLIEETENNIFHAKIEGEREFLNYLQKEKAVTYELNLSLRKYLRLKKDFVETFERIYKYKGSVDETEKICNDIENIGLHNNDLKRRLKEIKTEYFRLKQDIFDVKCEIDDFEIKLEDMKKS